MPSNATGRRIGRSFFITSNCKYITPRISKFLFDNLKLWTLENVVLSGGSLLLKYEMLRGVYPEHIEELSITLSKLNYFTLNVLGVLFCLRIR